MEVRVTRDEDWDQLRRVRLRALADTLRRLQKIRSAN